jgi:hypothetical protein
VKIYIYKQNFQNGISTLTALQPPDPTDQPTAIQHIEKPDNGIFQIIYRILDTACDRITKLLNPLEDF